MATSRLLELFLARRDALTDADRATLARIPVRRESYADGEVIIPRGPTPDESCLLVKGMATRVHHTAGEGRLISAIHVPGDFVDLHSLLLEKLDHDVVAAGDVKVEFVPAEALVEVTRTEAHLTRMLWLSTLIDASTHRAWIVARSTLKAPERLGHLLCELRWRLAAVGLIDNEGFAMPFDQKGLAAALGYSAVHMNRAVQNLRGRDLLEWRDGHVRLPNPEGLAATSHFDPAYLEIGRHPR